MSELSDYKRLVEKPNNRKIEQRIANLEGALLSLFQATNPLTESPDDMPARRRRAAILLGIS